MKQLFCAYFRKNRNWLALVVLCALIFSMVFSVFFMGMHSFYTIEISALKKRPEPKAQGELVCPWYHLNSGHRGPALNPCNGGYRRPISWPQLTGAFRGDLWKPSTNRLLSGSGTSRTLPDLRSHNIGGILSSFYPLVKDELSAPAGPSAHQHVHIFHRQPRLEGQIDAIADDLDHVAHPLIDVPGGDHQSLPRAGQGGGV